MKKPLKTEEEALQETVAALAAAWDKEVVPTFEMSDEATDAALKKQYKRMTAAFRRFGKEAVLTAIKGYKA